ncbi:MAG: cytochrome c family protein [Bacteroidales bacterium]|nr:cytochrome c family protein [Bacteroidales bacterium]
MLTKRVFTFAMLVFFAGGALMAQNFKYIGASKCKMCHIKPATGEQYNIWLKGPHAGAMKTLANEESKKIAAEKGIADPTTDAACIKCHSTIGRVDASLIASATLDEGVYCESCHGPGSMYKGASVMKNKELAMTKGLIDPTEAVCKTCHNEESPTYKQFNYAEMVAKIAHPNPSK